MHQRVHWLSRSAPRSLSQHCCAQRGRRRAALRVHAAFTVVSASGQTWQVDKATWSIGSAPGADLQIQGPNVAAEHAQLTQKGKQVFAKALVGESIFDDTGSWLDGQQMRAGVAYVLAAGSQLAFGETGGGDLYTVEFEEPSGSNPLVEMMMQGMAAGASSDVKQALGQL